MQVEIKSGSDEQKNNLTYILITSAIKYLYLSIGEKEYMNIILNLYTFTISYKKQITYLLTNV